MPIITLDNENTKSRYRIASTLVNQTKAVCDECLFITSDDPELPFARTLSLEEARKWSVLTHRNVVSVYYCGCQGFD
jgi:hypothetical protein